MTLTPDAGRKLLTRVQVGLRYHVHLWTVSMVRVENASLSIMYSWMGNFGGYLRGNVGENQRGAPTYRRNLSF